MTMTAIDTAFANFPFACSLTPGLEVIERIDSTNVELARRERLAPQPHFASLVTLEQTAGRGRLGRSWVAPAGASVALSVVLRPTSAPQSKWGLVTLLGGLAAREAIATQLPGADVALKWPNDVLIGGRKVAGVLAQLVPETGAIVLGVGINTAMTTEQLPVPTATSIAIESGATHGRDACRLADDVVTEYLVALAGLFARFEAARGDIDLAGLRDQLESACGTLGELVRVELPGGEDVRGQAIGIGADGSLLIATPDGGSPAEVFAGDVTHLRHV
ncbi:MAG TPA: biotin--[acetyl-CoA-carboxylase] ligase [Microbacteriaceae bacterium]|nr:biotin--[acetyl-CoA-carboxylase] ligase [Microbacteriaceae bacterium]